MPPHHWKGDFIKRSIDGSSAQRCDRGLVHARDFLELRLGEKLARPVKAACIDRKVERWPDRTSLRPWSRTTLEISSGFCSGKSSHGPTRAAAGRDTRRDA